MSSFLERMRQGRSRHGLRRFLMREAVRAYNRRVRPIRGPDLVRVLRELGVRPGATLCVHSSLSRFGYFEGGPEAVIEGLIEAAGPEGTVLMPTFPTAGSMVEYIESGTVFDVQRTPSKVGRLTEVFRTRPEVQRSLHPTNSVAARGPRANEFLEGHERSLTPYGHETPYGRLARDPRALILMMETHVHSFLHHLQERVDFPNLFLPERRRVELIDAEGKRRTMETRLMRRRIPYWVAIPAASGEVPDWAILHDYALMFPKRRIRRCRELGYTFEGYPRLFRRQAELEAAGVLRSGRLGAGRIGVLEPIPFLQHIEREFRELIDRFRSHYDPDRIAALKLPYG